MPARAPLSAANITGTADKKSWVTRYLPVQDQELLEGLAEYKEATKTYEEFKKAAQALYAGNDENHLHTLHEWNLLLANIQSAGIRTEKELAAFFRQFMLVSTFLIGKNRLSETERSHAFLRALNQGSKLHTDVKNRMMMLKPSQHPDDPYEISALYDATRFCLGGTAAYTVTVASPSTTAPGASEPAVKTDPAIAALVSTMTEFIKVMTLQQTQAASNSNSNSATNQQRPRNNNCGFCNSSTHFIGRCEHVDPALREGLCKRNANNKLVLPNGSFLPREIEGEGLLARFKKWHEQNPGNKVVPQMIVDLVTGPSAAATFVLTEDQRIEALQAEILAMQTRKEAPPITKPVKDQAPAKPTATAKETAPEPPSGKFPEHPYAGARDAAYAPPQDRNVGAPPKPAPRSPPSVCQEEDARNVMKTALDAPVTLSQRQLLSLAPEYRSLMRDSITPRRQPPKDSAGATQLSNTIADDEAGFEALGEYAEALALEHAAETKSDAIRASLPETFTTAAGSAAPTDGFIVPDPLSVYYSQGLLPDSLVVSADSKAIRCILPIVDNQRAIESIVDPGSQICAMSEAICHDLAYPYDPTVVLQMQSANGAITPSLGLARNVPFKVGEITLYLQVHVVRNPAYDILLGRPFDVLTQSVVRNYGNDDQTITIRDPNTGKTSTVPTLPRGSSRNNDEQDFLYTQHSPTPQ
ncbi:Integrase catalytic domain-containing protein [Mycena chlorophos]|uniref:Integrase catalytic domain-containing protein n=1 Tax=Mycena chlorophos TaxID=658473 RepID=A0A8H6RWZ3_MYCCL|nr:Integrase catalytic domain-containing protein [Mycena chlorophos]